MGNDGWMDDDNEIMSYARFAWNWFFVLGILGHCERALIYHGHTFR